MMARFFSQCKNAFSRLSLHSIRRVPVRGESNNEQMIFIITHGFGFLKCHNRYRLAFGRSSLIFPVNNGTHYVTLCGLWYKTIYRVDPLLPKAYIYRRHYSYHIIHQKIASKVRLLPSRCASAMSLQVPSIKVTEHQVRYQCRLPTFKYKRRLSFEDNKH